MIPGEVSEQVADAGVWLGLLVATATLATILWVWVGRPIWREWRENRDFRKTFRSDWMGEPARDGVPARPGVMARLADMGNDWAHLSDRVRKLERELLKVRSEVTFLLTHRCPEHATTPPENEEG